jgi:hypothetical protein
MLLEILFSLSLYGQTEAKAAEAVTPGPGQAPAPAPPAPAPPPFTGSVGLNLISITGNATAITFSATGLGEYKTPDWIFAFKTSGTYGQSKPPTSDPNASPQVVALAASLQLRLDRRISQPLSAYVLGGVETDHVKSVEVRGIAEAGAGIIWVDVKEADFERWLFRTDLAFHYAHETRFQYYRPPNDTSPLVLPDATLYAPKLGVAFRYGLSKDVAFVETAEVLPNVVGDSRVVVNSLAKLTVQLIRSLSLTTGFTVNYDSAPAPSKVSTDTALSVGLEYQL